MELHQLHRLYLFKHRIVIDKEYGRVWNESAMDNYKMLFYHWTRFSGNHGKP
jgi:hypothetical protein